MTLNLIAAMALPVILYASEALPLTKAIVKTREHPWSRVFMKIFGTFSEHIVANVNYIQALNLWNI